MTVTLGWLGDRRFSIPDLFGHLFFATHYGIPAVSEVPQVCFLGDGHAGRPGES
jgi:hypothetical protein